MTRALVFSGTSFIASHLCRALRQAGMEVCATTRAQEGSQKCDVRRFAEVFAAVTHSRPDVVFLCAAATRAHDATTHYSTHVGGALNVLRAVAQVCPAASLVLFGSAAEYGRVPAGALPVVESCAATPTTSFGRSKLAQTHLAGAAAARWGLRVTVLRPFNVIGPGLPDHYLPGALLRRLQARATAPEPFPVASGLATRDFVDVRDVVRAALAVAGQPPPPGQVAIYNVATEQETRVLDVARYMAGRLGIRREMAAAALTPSRSEIVRSCGAWGKLQAATGWQPRIAWQDSIDAFLDASAACQPAAVCTRRRHVRDKALGTKP